MVTKRRIKNGQVVYEEKDGQLVYQMPTIASIANEVLSKHSSYGNPEFEKVIEEVLAMHRRKGADYGTKDDFFANVSASQDWGISPWVGAMMRANDKVVRLQSASRGSTLQNEGIEDSLLDIATYAVIALCLFRRES
jgi:hypothetical protein